MTPLQRLENIADGIRELYPTASVTVAIDLPLSDIEKVLSHFGEGGSAISDILKKEGTSLVISINRVAFALCEKKVDPQMN